MPECHKCKHNISSVNTIVDSIRSANASKNNNHPCLTCHGPSDDPSHEGRNLVSLDALNGFESVIETQTPPEDYDRASEVLRVMGRVSAIDREIIYRRMAGETFADIAGMIQSTFKTESFTLQAVAKRLKKLLGEWPLLQEVFVEAVVKQKRRKK